MAAVHSGRSVSIMVTDQHMTTMIQCLCFACLLGTNTNTSTSKSTDTNTGTRTSTSTNTAISTTTNATATTTTTQGMYAKATTYVKHNPTKQLGTMALDAAARGDRSPPEAFAT